MMEMNDCFFEVDNTDMSRHLNDGKNPVRDAADNWHRLTEELSRGGQGVVYRTGISDIVVKIDLTDDEKANDRYMDLRLLPIPQGLHITLPILPLKDERGYVMRLLDDMESFAQAFSKRSEDEIAVHRTTWLDEVMEVGGANSLLFSSLIANGGLRRIFKSYMQAAAILAELHATGLVYCDFSINNVFVSSNREFCNVWLIDADNVCYSDQAAQCYWHTPNVAAPEVCSMQRGDSFASDVFAFASSLFQQLLHIHPFEGAAYEESLNEEERTDLEDRRNMGAFSYVRDEDDDSNLVDFDGLDEMLIPPKLSELFLETFGAGRLAPGKRPLMSEWTMGLASSLDKIIHCPTCGMDFNFEVDNMCPWCDARHPMLIVKSSYSKEFWTFTHEIISASAVDVPLRIIHGCICKENLENLFRVSWDGIRLKITLLRNDIECYTAEEKKINKYETDASKCHLSCYSEAIGMMCSVSFEVMT